MSGLRQRGQSGTRLLRAEPGHARRIRRAVEGQPEEEARRAGDEQVDGDAHDHLIGAEANGRHRIQEGQRRAAGDRAEESDPGTSTVVARHRAAERAAEHVSLEPKSDQTRALRDDAAARREQIWNRDAQRLREEGEYDHAVLLASRRTSGTDAATAMMTTACRTSTICFGTTAFTARPPWDIVAKTNAASTTPTG
jgi:hypothetical protein